MPSAITADFAGRGYGSSGVLQSEIARSHGERIGALNDMEGKFAGFQIDQDNQAQDMASRLLASGRGSSTTQTQGGNPVGSGISSGLETLTTLLTLGRMMKGGGGNTTSSPPNGFDSFGFGKR